MKGEGKGREGGRKGMAPQYFGLKPPMFTARQHGSV